MGMDLIMVGWTQNRKSTDKAELVALIDELLDTTLLARKHELDESGLLEVESESEDEDPRILREWLKDGADTYAEMDARRVAQSWVIPETDLRFMTAGGGSWGDDPFDGWSSLCMFLAACEVFPALGEAAGYVCGGLPSPSIAAAH